MNLEYHGSGCKKETAKEVKLGGDAQFGRFAFVECIDLCLTKEMAKYRGCIATEMKQLEILLEGYLCPCLTGGNVIKVSVC